MSGNTDPAKSGQPAKPAKPSRPDPRVLRTRDTLGDALVLLMQEKPFDEITVQNVLDRAGVGRSTFYTHYRDKEDLFLSDVEDFFAAMSSLLTRKGAPPQRLAPVHEMCSHLTEIRPFYAALVASGKLRDVTELGQGFFARSIEERLRLARVSLEPLPLRIHSQALAAACLTLLFWWIDHQEERTPEQMDAMFHQLAWSGVGSLPASSPPR